MANSAPLLVGAGVVLGGVVSALVVQLGQPDAPATTSDSRTLQSIEAVARQVTDLDQNQRELMRRFQDFELALLARPAGAPAEQELTADLSGDALASLREEIDELAANMGRASSEGEGGPMVNTVIEALELVEDQRRAERDAMRDERRAERMDRQLDRLTEDLDLDANQQSQMKDLLADAQRRRDELDDQDLPRDERRDARDALDADTMSKASAFLTSTQWSSLDEGGGLSTGGGRGGWGGPDGGGGGGGGGRRGR